MVNMFFKEYIISIGIPLIPVLQFAGIGSLADL